MPNRLKNFYERLTFYKRPEFENDSFYIRMEGFLINEFQLNHMRASDSYLDLKLKKFQNFDASTKGFEKFKDRLSLREIDPDKELNGTIYTVAVTRQNYQSYHTLIELIKEILEKNPRRAALRLANPLNDYYDSTFVNSSVDVTCLNMIYYGENNVKLVFRASDVKDELLTDIVTVYVFFIEPIYKDQKITLDIFASTAQNIKYFNEI